MSTIELPLSSAIAKRPFDLGLDLSRRPTSAEAAQDRDSALFTGYSLLLAYGLLMHQLAQGNWDLFGPWGFLTITAVWQGLRPSSVRLFSLVAVAQIVNCVVFMPFVVNHWLFLALMELAVLLCAAKLWINSRPTSPHPGALYREVLPVLRTLVLLMYGFAALSKLNSGFFDVELSSAVALYGHVAERLHLPQNWWTSVAAIWGTVIIELMLPIALLYPRTRAVGVLGGIGFHIAMGLSGHIPFSAPALACLFLFVPDDLPHRLEKLQAAYGRISRWLARIVRFTRHRLAIPAATAICSALIGIKFLQLLPRHQIDFVVYRAEKLFFYPAALAAMYVLLLCIRQPGKLTYKRRSFHPTRFVHVAVPLLMVLNCLCPYVGLKTECSITMFSNLRTEVDRWNHFFMPQAMRVFAFQNDPVRIISSSDPKLQKSADEGVDWIYFDFVRYVTERPELAVAFEYQGRIEKIQRAADHPISFERQNVLLQKLFWFREIPPVGNNYCQH